MVFASIVLYKQSYQDIKFTLDSLLACKQIMKIILVDNDSSDWASKFSNPKIIYVKSDGNYGFGYGHNIAIQMYANQSEYFLICNPDIKFSSYEFDKLVKFADSRKEGLFLPKIVYQNGENQYGARLLPSAFDLFSRRFSPRLAEKLDEYYLIKRKNIVEPVFAPYLSGCFMFFRSEALLALGGFDEQFFMYMEDVDLSRRCASKFGNVYYPLAKVTHLHERASHKNINLLKAHLKSAFQYFNKWGWFYDSERNILNRNCLKQFSEY